MVVWNRPRGIRSQGCLFASLRWGKSKKRVLTATGRPSSTRLFALLGKAHSKWWYQNRNRGIRSQGSLFASPRWGKSKKRVLNAIGRPSSTRLFALLGKAHSKWWYQNRNRGIRSQGSLFASPRWGKSKKRVLNAIGRPSSTRLFALLGKAHPKWWYDTDLVEFDRKGVYSLCSDWESQKNLLQTQLDDLRQPDFFRCLEKPTLNGGMKPTSWNSIARVFIRFAPMGKVKKTRFKRNWTTFVNPAFCAAWKSPP